MASLSHSQRLRTVLAGGVPDRTPLALWRHWPKLDQSGAALARATIDFQRRYDFDFVKLCPASNYAVDGWGGHSEWRGHPVGTRDWVHHAIQHPDDWTKLRPLDPHTGLRGELLAALRLVRAELGPDIPLIPTVFNPLAMAKYLAGEPTLSRHLREAPDAVLAGLHTLAETLARFLEAARPTGIDGVFFAVQHASCDQLDEADYARFGTPFDLHALTPVADAWFNLLHLHASNPLFTLVDRYPVAAVNWHAHETAPDLATALHLTRKTLCGGLGTLFPLRDGSPADVISAVNRVRASVDPHRLILSAGCVLPLATPEVNIAAAGTAVAGAPAP